MEQREVLLEKLQEETQIPEIVYLKAEQAFKQIRLETEPPAGNRRKQTSSLIRKKSVIIILAAVLMIGTLSVSAATYFHWNDKFKEAHEVTPVIEKKLNDSNTARELNQFTEHDGVRLEAVQSVADSTAAIIVIKITGSEQFPLQKRMNFRDVNVNVDAPENHISMSGGFLDLESPDAQPGDVLNEGRTWEFVLTTDHESGLLGREITLTFTDIIDAAEEQQTLTDLPPLLQSTWELKIVLDNEDNGKEYVLDQQLPGSEAKVKKLRISPVSFTIDYDWKRQMKQETVIDENGETQTFEHAVDPPELIGVVLEDGTALEYITDWYEGHYSNEAFTEYQGNGIFSRFIEYEKVKELIFYVANEAGTDYNEVRIPITSQ